MAMQEQTVKDGPVAVLVAASTGPRRRPATSKPNRSVLLDHSWAKKLGISRTGGVYRIGRRELMRRLGLEQTGRDSGARPSIQYQPRHGEAA